MKTVFYSLLCLLALPISVSANEALIIAVYDNCTAESSTIVFEPGQLDPMRADNIVAQAEAAGTGLSFDKALPLKIASLESNGIKNIQVQKYGECGVAGHGKYVEAIATYCSGQLANAEVHIDGTVFLHRSGSDLEFDTFVTEARQKLQEIGIFDNPRLSVNNLSDCQQNTAS